MKNKSIYFASDFHLGLDHAISSLEREKRIVKWLDTIKDDCGILYLVGDIFDYWFEYKEAIPKGSTRLLGKLCELSDLGLEIHLFTGNHDMWIFDYFTKEIGLRVHYKPLDVEHFGNKFHIAHGDGLGPGDKAYKIIKKIFTNKLCQWLFHRLHPNFGLWLMKKASQKSREADLELTSIANPENEWLILYSEAFIKSQEVDFFVFGHRHFPMTYRLSNNKTQVIYLGDWLTHFSYAKYNEAGMQLFH